MLKEVIYFMKKLVFAYFMLMCMFIIAVPAYCNTIITVPIDGRPISDEYLGNLAKVGGDNFIAVGNDNMDFFSSYEPDNHIANSKEIRKELYNTVANNNTTDTTVIINTSSYITNGLVGSRCGINYNDKDEALNDLKQLVTDFKNPKYYINLAMPRSLPETRFNQIWPDNNNMTGLGHYYLIHNKDDINHEEISARFTSVTPIQYIMEFSYIDNKASEIGYKNLTPWEQDFITHFNNEVKNNELYKEYVNYYKEPYLQSRNIFETLLNWQTEGLINEIIISTDDLQIPNSISYFNTKKANWVQNKNNSPIKYSYARAYMEIMPDSIEKTIAKRLTPSEVGRAVNGNGRNINIIYGTDEIPQMIYARDYTARHNKTPRFNITYNDVSQGVATFDVVQTGHITRTAINFTKGNVGNYTTKDFNLYIYDYKVRTNSVNQFYNKMTKASKDNNIGLIELFNGKSDNELFNMFVNGNKYSLSTLNTYSAWNTSANAIGLGVAHSQVFAIVDEMPTNANEQLAAHINMLLQHFIEDGIYSKSGKLELVNKGYRPNVEDRTNSQTLIDLLNTDIIVNSMQKGNYTLGSNNYTASSIEVGNISFPWGRTFEIYITSKANIKPA